MHARHPITRLLSPTLVPVFTVAVLVGQTACIDESAEADYLVGQADAHRGGALWDRWWLVEDVLEPVEPGFGLAPDTPDWVQSSSVPADNPRYVQNPAGNLRRGPDTWRCAECHGWDYAGKSGEYGVGSLHYTGFGGVWSQRDADPAVLYESIAVGTDGSPGHAFARVLAPLDIADLVKFIREGTVPRSDFVNAAGQAHGDLERGLGYLAANCSDCHGEDGRKLNLAEGDESERYLAEIAVVEPARFVHKVRFGEPDNSMPNAKALHFGLAEVADVLAYSRTLPLVPARCEPATKPRTGSDR